MDHLTEQDQHHDCSGLLRRQPRSRTVSHKYGPHGAATNTCCCRAEHRTSAVLALLTRRAAVIRAPECSWRDVELRGRVTAAVEHVGYGVAIGTYKNDVVGCACGVVGGGRCLEQCGCLWHGHGRAADDAIDNGSGACEPVDNGDGSWDVVGCSRHRFPVRARLAFWRDCCKSHLGPERGPRLAR